MCKDTGKTPDNTIEELQLLDEYYYIDYIPYETSDSKFLELENFYEKTYIHSFAKKMARIALKLIYYYPCAGFYLSNVPVKPISLKYKYNFKDNLRDSPPKKLSYFIKQIIMKDFSAAQILFSDPVFLISIDGGFSNAIYQPTSDVLKILKLLVEQEGLFIKHKNSADERSLVHL